MSDDINFKVKDTAGNLVMVAAGADVAKRFELDKGSIKQMYRHTQDGSVEIRTGKCHIVVERA